ncbi:hypothetical protein F4802DRAFT_581463 [Xylaria palmicola]|nr:hypothetical protein F4802DRAFT_581463 [Xylaria palmicola]
MPKHLTDQEIGDATNQLAAFHARSAEENFLQRYADLLVSYQQLKSDFEEEKVNRERYKQLARTRERNPFVLVLVDGDGYIFSDEFLQQGADGGSQAALQLNNMVKKSLRKKNLENCDIVVRIYANIASLSKTLSKHGLATPDKRSLGPFLANFNRSYSLMDFVDAGELKEGADFKIRALLDLYAENAQCKHIYFAACHDIGYCAPLTKFRGNQSRFTLIQSPGVTFHNQFLQLELGIEGLPGVFRTKPLDVQPHHTRLNSSTDSVKMLTSASHIGSPATTENNHRGISSSNVQKICHFYQTGKCRFGGECRNVHIDATTPTNPTKPLYASQTSHRSIINVNSWRAKSSVQESDSAESGMVSPRSEPQYQLPKKSDIPAGHVAVNRNSERLDPYMAPPSLTASSRLRELSGITKFCNNKQLKKVCLNENCEYEHKPLPEDLLPALEWLSRSLPCSKRGSCRTSSCVLGHICQNMECHYRGGKTKCKLSAYAHEVEFALDLYVPDQNHLDTTDITNTVGSSPTTAASHLSGHVNQVPDGNPWDFS